jgi:HEAT repeat protein
MQTRSLKRGWVDTPVSAATPTPHDADATYVQAVARGMMEDAAKEHISAKEEQLAAKAILDTTTAAMKAAEMDYAAKEKLATAASSKWLAAKVRYTSGNFTDKEALTSLADAIISTFKDPDRNVRKKAVYVLGNLGQTILASHTNDIIGMLNDICEWVRFGAVRALGKLSKAALVGHANALANMLRDPQPFVIQEAVKALTKLDPAELAPHAGAIVQLLAHAKVTVHHTAMDAFGKLDRDALTPHVSAIVFVLTDPDWVTRFGALKALGKLNAAVLASRRYYSDAILSLLHDENSMVRTQAAKVIIILEEAQTALHAGAIVSMLTHIDAAVRRDAFKLVARKLAAGNFKLVASNTDAKRTPEEALALVISAIANMHTTGELNDWAWSGINTLRTLKTMLARMHWATARVYRPVARWYGWVWYEEACKSLYAPGGKWAERDRAAFEDEFC